MMCSIKIDDYDDDNPEKRLFSYFQAYRHYHHYQYVIDNNKYIDIIIRPDAIQLV